MYSIPMRLLDQKTLQTGDVIDPSVVPDLGDAHEIEILVTVLTAATAGAGGDTPLFLVKHAPVNDTQYYVDFPTIVAVDLTKTGSTWIHVPYFLRYIAWFLSGTMESGAVVTLDVIAKG